MEEPEKQVCMGMGEMGNSATDFCRKSRWLLSADNLPASFGNKAKFNYIEKTIEFEYFDVMSNIGSAHALVWANRMRQGLMPHETMTFISLDGCGFEVYRMDFDRLTLLSHESCDFDYDSSDVAYQKIKVSYEDVDITVQNAPKETVNFTWTCTVQDSLGNELMDFPVTVHQRPAVQIEEVPINYLNSTIKIPGKVTWKNVTITLPKEDAYKIIQHSNAKKDSSFNGVFTTVLNYYRNDSPVEKWTLKDCRMSGLEFSGDKCKTKLDYKSANYERINGGK